MVKAQVRIMRYKKAHIILSLMAFLRLKVSKLVRAASFTERSSPSKGLSSIPFWLTQQLDPYQLRK
jgi:hypothetical protein